ncbi:MAG: hypothetical protein AAF734_05570 [Bacteroidota bacterium]
MEQFSEAEWQQQFTSGKIKRNTDEFAIARQEDYERFTAYLGVQNKERARNQQILNWIQFYLSSPQGRLRQRKRDPFWLDDPKAVMAEAWQY